jgi:LmbE family N-acetylglucosaminyl deacetylase
MSNVVVIAPHPDDESIGCGGTIGLHVEQGDRVAVFFLTSGELGLKHLPREKAWAVREEEARAAAEVLGIGQLHFLRQPDWFLGDSVAAAAEVLRPILQQEKPSSIYLPHPNEWHPDHKASLPIVEAALAGSDLKPELLMYEVWTPLGAYDHVEDISAVMARKLQAVRRYTTQLNGFRYDRAVRGLNQYRGVIAAKCRYAEVFQYAFPGAAGARV